MESIIAVLCFLLLLITVRQYLSEYFKLKNKQLNLAEVRVLSAFNYKETKSDLNMFINAFITDCMQDYVMYNIVPNTGLDYINKEKEDEIRKALVSIVTNRLSDTIKKKILLCYSEQHFTELLAEKIFYVVTVYVADFNSEKPVHYKETKKKSIDKLKKLDEENIDTDW